MRDESSRGPEYPGIEIQRIPGFRVTIGTEPSLESPVGDVYFNDDIVAVITQERGNDMFDIEFWPRRDKSEPRLDLSSFLAAVHEATARLSRLNGPKAED
jgi:hypothetical protein